MAHIAAWPNLDRMGRRAARAPRRSPATDPAPTATPSPTFPFHPNVGK